MFFILHQLKNEQGPEIPIERDADNKIICKCVTSDGIRCTKRFGTKNGLEKHLKKIDPEFWVVSYIYLIIIWF